MISYKFERFMSGYEKYSSLAKAMKVLVITLMYLGEVLTVEDFSTATSPSYRYAYGRNVSHGLLFRC